MSFQMNANQTQRFNVQPVLADGVTVSKATLSGVVYLSGDPAILEATPDTDPTNVNGVVLKGLGTPGTIVVTVAALATEPDGTTTEKIAGSLTVVLIPLPPPPPPPPPAPAAALVFVPVGTPTP